MKVTQLQLFAMPTTFEQDSIEWYKITKNIYLKLSIDSFMTMVTGKKVLDIIKMDKELSKKVQFPGKNMSFNNMIKHLYGQQALDIIEKWS